MRIFRLALLSLLITKVSTGVLSAQDKSYQSWFIKEIAKDSAFLGRINITILPGSKPFFWPSDGPYKKADFNFQNEHLIKTKSGFLTAIEGTGRVYKIDLDDKHKSGLRFTRLDSTIFFGYNFGATVFYLRDTLYSLGGYGLWNFPWHLRYYRPSSNGWEVIPVNREVRHIFSPHNYFLDGARQKLYSIESHYFSEGLKDSNPKSKNFKRLLDTVYVDLLDLNTKNWEHLGMLTPEFKNILYTGYFICDTPFGKVLTTGDRLGNKGYLYDFSSNKLKELTDKKLAIELHDALLVGKNNSTMPEKLVSYYFDDSIKLLNSDGNKFSKKIVASDFKDTGINIWIPATPSSASSLALFKNQLILILGLTTFCVGLWLLYKSRNSAGFSSASLEFDKQELKLLAALSAHPALILKPEDVDQLIENGARSPDALKKRRSILIRSINKKYSEQFDDEEDLIRTERLDSDRRMVQYVMDGKKYGKVQRGFKEPENR